MMIMASCYAGSLISFFSVDVYRHPPETMDELRSKVVQNNQEVIVCCSDVMRAMQDSISESYRDLASRVRP